MTRRLCVLASCLAFGAGCAGGFEESDTTAASLTDTEVALRNFAQLYIEGSATRAACNTGTVLLIGLVVASEGQFATEEMVDSDRPTCGIPTESAYAEFRKRSGVTAQDGLASALQRDIGVLRQAERRLRAVIVQERSKIDRLQTAWDADEISDIDFQAQTVSAEGNQRMAKTLAAAAEGLHYAAERDGDNLRRQGRPFAELDTRAQEVGAMSRRFASYARQIEELYERIPDVES